MSHPQQLPTLDNWVPHATAQGVFTPDECRRILELRGDVAAAEIVGEGRDQATQAAYRKSRVAWLKPDKANEWLFAKTFQVVQQVNQQCYKMELSGFTEPLQVGEYGEGQYYDWHLDVGRGPHSIRKLSFIVQLSDPAGYRGGEVELLCANQPAAIPKDQGAMTVFPAYLLHRVKAVESGLRHSLVGWIGGPHLR